MEKYYIEQYNRISDYIYELKLVRDYPFRYRPDDLKGIDVKKELRKLKNIIKLLDVDWCKIAEKCERKFDE